MAVFWDVALVEIYRRSGDTYRLRRQTNETSVDFYQITRRNITEDSHHHTRRPENLKFQRVFGRRHI